MAIQKEIPFEYHDDKLGVKVKFLIKDDKVVSAHEDSLRLISYNALYRRMKSKTQPEKELRRASLGFDALVEFGSLVREWRDALEIKFGKPAEQVRESFFAKHYISDQKAFDFFCAHRYGEDEDKKLPPEAIELYTYNASVLNTVVKVRNKRKIYAKSLGVTGQFDIWQSLSNDVNAFQDVRHDLPTTKDSLRHKVNRYIKEGYASVISRKYGMKNAARVKDDEQLSLLRVLLTKHQNLDNEQVADKYNEIAIAINWATITGATVANYRKKYNLYVYAGTRGETNFMHQKEMQIKRSKPSGAMLFWSVDGWKAELMYQKTVTNAKGHRVTGYTHSLTAVMVLDPYNDYIIGYAIGHEENPALIRQALKNAVNHTQELFGQRYKTFQLQTDNYQLKHLTPVYSNVAKYFTPSKVKNAKAKPVESFFNRFNKEYFQKGLAPNWSGHNVTAKKSNQPNADYLTKIKHLFPDEAGCRQQLITAIENDRAKKLQAYLESWENVEDEFKVPMSYSQYMRVFGETTGYTNKMNGNGLTPTINGIERAYDSFDLNFRKYTHEDWKVYYDVEDLSQVLVTNAKGRNGKLIEEVGTLEFVLEEKYIQPMAIADQIKADAGERAKVSAYNKNLREDITSLLSDDHDMAMDLFRRNPQLENLQKLIIPNSLGQHKEPTQMALKATKLFEKQERQADKKAQNNWKETQDDYLKNKVNLNKYAEL